MFTGVVSKGKEVRYRLVYVLCPDIAFLIECRNTNELSSRVHSTPMVQNPIYEGGVIYEEIPDVRAKQKNLSTENGEDVPTGDIDVTSSGMCDIVSTSYRHTEVATSAF